MTQSKWLIGGLLALAFGLVVYTFVSPKATDNATETEEASATIQKRGGSKTAKSLDQGKGGKELTSAAKAKGAKGGASRQGDPSKGESDIAKDDAKRDPVKQAAAEKAVEAWETLVDTLVESTEPVTKKRMAKVKEAFDTLDSADQMDAIQRSLNLLPDEQFTSLFGILYDKTENPEILDAIFSDALNRPEEIKVPMMKDFLFDKTHPMFFESARILDVTGELDKMAGTDDQEEGMEEEEELPPPTVSP